MKHQQTSKTHRLYKFTAISVSIIFFLFSILQYATPVYAARPKSFFEVALKNPVKQQVSLASSLGQKRTLHETTDIETPFPSLESPENVTYSQLISIFSGKYETRNLLRGGPIAQPDFFVAFKEEPKLYQEKEYPKGSLSGNHSVILPFAQPEDVRDFKIVMAKILEENSAFPKKYIYKPNQDALGRDIFHLTKVSPTEIVLTMAFDNISTIMPIENYFKILGLKGYVEDIKTFTVQITLNPKEVDVLDILYRLWKLISDSSDRYDAGMIESAISAIKINGKAFETRHQFLGNLKTGYFDFLKGRWFSRIGSSAYFSNVGIGARREAASTIQGLGLFQPLIDAGYLKESRLSEFRDYVDETLKAEFLYLFKRIKKVGIPWSERLDGSFDLDLMWLAPKNGEFPKPVLIEAGMGIVSASSLGKSYPEPRVFLLDIDGVLLPKRYSSAQRWELIIEELKKRYGFSVPDETDLEALREDIAYDGDKSTVYYELLHGTMDMEAYIQRVNQKITQRSEKKAELTLEEWWELYFFDRAEIDPEKTAQIKKALENLKSISKEIGFLTDRLAGDEPFFLRLVRENYGDLFQEDLHFLSTDLGTSKASNNIYPLVLERLRQNPRFKDIQPEEILFLDDNSDNVEEAEVFGLHAVRFKYESDLMAPIFEQAFTNSVEGNSLGSKEKSLFSKTASRVKNWLGFGPYFPDWAPQALEIRHREDLQRILQEKEPHAIVERLIFYLKKTPNAIPEAWYFVNQHYKKEEQQLLIQVSSMDKLKQESAEKALARLMLEALQHADIVHLISKMAALSRRAFIFKTTGVLTHLAITANPTAQLAQKIIMGGFDPLLQLRSGGAFAFAQIMNDHMSLEEIKQAFSEGKFPGLFAYEILERSDGRRPKVLDRLELPEGFSLDHDGWFDSSDNAIGEGFQNAVNDVINSHIAGGGRVTEGFTRGVMKELTSPTSGLFRKVLSSVHGSLTDFAGQLAVEEAARMSRRAWNRNEEDVEISHTVFSMPQAAVLDWVQNTQETSEMKEQSDRFALSILSTLFVYLMKEKSEKETYIGNQYRLIQDTMWDGEGERLIIDLKLMVGEAFSNAIDSYLMGVYGEKILEDEDFSFGERILAHQLQSRILVDKERREFVIQLIDNGLGETSIDKRAIKRKAWKAAFEEGEEYKFFGGQGNGVSGISETVEAFGGSTKIYDRPSERGAIREIVIPFEVIRKELEELQRLQKEKEATEAEKDDEEGVDAQSLGEQEERAVMKARIKKVHVTVGVKGFEGFESYQINNAINNFKDALYLIASLVPQQNLRLKQFQDKVSQILNYRSIHIEFDKSLQTEGPFYSSEVRRGVFVLKSAFLFILNKQKTDDDVRLEQIFKGLLSSVKFSPEARKGVMQFLMNGTRLEHPDGKKVIQFPDAWPETQPETSAPTRRAQRPNIKRPDGQSNANSLGVAKPFDGDYAQLQLKSFMETHFAYFLEKTSSRLGQAKLVAGGLQLGEGFISLLSQITELTQTLDKFPREADEAEKKEWFEAFDERLMLIQKELNDSYLNKNGLYFTFDFFRNLKHPRINYILFRIDAVQTFTAVDAQGEVKDKVDIFSKTRLSFRAFGRDGSVGYFTPRDDTSHALRDELTRNVRRALVPELIHGLKEESKEGAIYKRIAEEMGITPEEFRLLEKMSVKDPAMKDHQRGRFAGFTRERLKRDLDWNPDWDLFIHGDMFEIPLITDTKLWRTFKEFMSRFDGIEYEQQRLVADLTPEFVAYLGVLKRIVHRLEQGTLRHEFRHYLERKEDFTRIQHETSAYLAQLAWGDYPYASLYGIANHAERNEPEETYYEAGKVIVSALIREMFKKYPFKDNGERYQGLSIEGDSQNFVDRLRTKNDFLAEQLPQILARLLTLNGMELRELAKNAWEIEFEKPLDDYQVLEVQESRQMESQLKDFRANRSEVYEKLTRLIEEYKETGQVDEALLHSIPLQERADADMELDLQGIDSDVLKSSRWKMITTIPRGDYHWFGKDKLRRLVQEFGRNVFQDISSTASKFLIGEVDWDYQGAAPFKYRVGVFVPVTAFFQTGFRYPSKPYLEGKSDQLFRLFNRAEADAVKNRRDMMERVTQGRYRGIHAVSESGEPLIIDRTKTLPLVHESTIRNVRQEMVHHLIIEAGGNITAEQLYDELGRLVIHSARSLDRAMDWLLSTKKGKAVLKDRLNFDPDSISIQDLTQNLNDEDVFAGWPEVVAKSLGIEQRYENSGLSEKLGMSWEKLKTQHSDLVQILNTTFNAMDLFERYINNGESLNSVEELFKRVSKVKQRPFSKSFNELKLLSEVSNKERITQVTMSVQLLTEIVKASKDAAYFVFRALRHLAESTEQNVGMGLFLDVTFLIPIVKASESGSASAIELLREVEEGVSQGLLSPKLISIESYVLIAKTSAPYQQRAFEQLRKLIERVKELKVDEEFVRLEFLEEISKAAKGYTQTAFDFLRVVGEIIKTGKLSKDVLDIELFERIAITTEKFEYDVFDLLTGVIEDVKRGTINVGVLDKGLLFEVADQMKENARYAFRRIEKLGQVAAKGVFRKDQVLEIVRKVDTIGPDEVLRQLDLLTEIWKRASQETETPLNGQEPEWLRKDLKGNSLGEEESQRAVVAILDNLSQRVNIFIGALDINNFSREQLDEIFKLAARNPKQLRVIVVNAAGYDKHPLLNLPNIYFTPQAELAAGEAIRKAKHNLHLSRMIDPAENFALVGENKFRYANDENGLLGVALLYTQSENPLSFLTKYNLRKVEGFFSSVQETLLALVQSHEADLLLSRAA